MMESKILVIDDLCKNFGPTKANNNINLTINKGSVHGLAGENGSGKSTLASIICGIQRKDSGRITKSGEEYAPGNPIDANRKKVAMVVQELGVLGNLSPAVNMYIGDVKRFSRFGVLSLKKMEEATMEQFEKWDLEPIPMNCPAEFLSIEQRKILELARALSSDPDFLVLDEISQTLSHNNRERLKKFIKKFVGMGKTILMITHDLEEMMNVCDTISVLRDGEIIETKSTSYFTMDELKRKMIGREVSGQYFRSDMEEQYKDDVVLEVEHLNVPNQLEDISFSLHRGEILGVCGLSDAGIHSLGKALFGLADHRSGKVLLKGTGKQLTNPKDIIKAGGAYLSKDRDADGLMLNATIGDNIAVPSAMNLSVGIGYLSPKKTKKLAQEALNNFEIASTGIDHAVKYLSGGNKQKVNLSRWLVKNLEFIILDCPTRGVDIGVKAYIYEVMKKAKELGLAIILISDELSEAMGMSDRILVMRDKKVSGVLSRSSDFTEDRIIEVML